jgi:hypothetical protein
MLETIVTAVISSSIAAGLIGFLAKSWIEARVKASIEHEYKKQFELFSRDLDRKDKIELVAHLLAEYMKIPQGEQMPRDQRLLLNKLSFISTIWLPATLAIEVSKRIQNKPDAKTPFELMLLARKELLGDESLTVEHVTIWSPVLEQRGDPVLLRPN